MKKISFKEIPSYKYRHFIKKLTKPFYKISHFSGTTVAIFLKTGEMAWLSTTPKTSLKIFATGLHRGDLLLQPKHNSFNRVVFPEEYTEIDETQSAINAILKNDKLYRGYCIVRACDDCSIMITCNVNTESINHRSFYESTIDYFEKCINDFLDDIISIYSELLPALSNCQFTLNSDYRHQVITTRHATKESTHLNDAELDVLYWSAQGKSANEIAAITGLTKNTVDTYRQRLIEKLSADNITQAVYIAAKSGFIA
ncbi:MAG: LuxR C-terminal-related transcriptional regulator [Coxiellaceae bacterium]|nr:LuxR C-terminal-related transcriptional regulator [Coxiellaceae bacterium]